MENRISKDPPETPQRSVLGTPRRTNPTQGSIGIGEGVERMVGVTSVNLGGIDVDVEDVADRLRRLKVFLSLKSWGLTSGARSHTYSHFTGIRGVFVSSK
jgi:hypothetical protein